MHSSDSGQNWSNQNIAENCYAIWFNSVENGLAGGRSLFYTTNSGANWIPSNSPDTNNIVLLTGTGNTFWTAMGNVIYKSTDLGFTWIAEHSVGTVNSKFLQLEVSNSGESVWASNSEGFITRFGYISNINPINNLIVKDWQLNQNYPNPFNPKTNINFSISKNGFTTLKVFCIDGKEIATLVNEDLKSGNYSVSFSGSDLS